MHNNSKNTKTTKKKVFLWRHDDVVMHCSSSPPGWTWPSSSGKEKKIRPKFCVFYDENT